MADVLIVCVREDEGQAKTLADMFEAAGFTVGGAPANDAALRSSGAGVVVWSQSSIRSRPFLDAAQRVINAGKGVLACLIEPPPPDSVNNSPAFDLSTWNGEADDPSLDPIFFAVDRMVNSQRASVGAASSARGAAETNLRAPVTPPPSYSRPRAAPPQPQLPPGFQTRTSPSPRPTYQEPPSHDALGSEAEHWRAIRHSKDPTAFLDYLARYGPEGAFAELAEFRLKQLEGGGAPTPPPQNLRGAARAAEPQMRFDPPPQRRPEPPPRAERVYEVPQRRAEPQRRPDPPPAPRYREPGFERDYRPPIDHHRNPDEPKGGGRMLRLLALILVIGGVIAFGIYNGWGDRLQAMFAPGNSPQQTDLQQSASNEPYSAPVTESAPDQGIIPQAQVLEPSTPSVSPSRQPRDQQVVSNTTNSRAAAPNRTPTRDPADTTTPTPQTSWGAPGTTPLSGSQTTGGPVSLLPSDAGSVTVPLSPPVESATPTSSSSTPSGPPPSVVWAQRATAQRLASVYPPNALRDGQAGSAQLDCVVRSDLGVTCMIARETPASEGFGRAALNAVAYFRSRPTLSNGETAVGARTHISMSFRPPSR